MCWGIFDIGTRATRLLVIHPSNIQQRHTESELTHLGSYLGPEGLSPEGIERLISSLQGCYQRSQSVAQPSLFFAVGTSALREAKNQQEIIRKVQEELGLSISILSGKEEAYLSLLPIFYHFPRALSGGAPFLLIDQGGGSTEVSAGRFHEEIQLLGGASFPLGTERLKAHFLSDPERPVGESYYATLAKISEVLAPYQPESISSSAPTCAFAMGSAITRFTGLHSNRKQHGMRLSLQALREASYHTSESYQAEQCTIHEWLTEQRKEQFDQDVLSLFGLPVYAEFLRNHQLSELKVCGYGLRYGVYYYHQTQSKHPDLVQGLTLNHTPSDAISLKTT